MHLAEQLIEVTRRRLFEALETEEGGDAWIVHVVTASGFLKELAEKILQLAMGVK